MKAPLRRVVSPVLGPYLEVCFRSTWLQVLATALIVTRCRVDAEGDPNASTSTGLQCCGSRQNRQRGAVRHVLHPPTGVRERQERLPASPESLAMERTNLFSMFREM